MLGWKNAQNTVLLGKDNGILMETIGISVMVSIGLQLFLFSRVHLFAFLFCETLLRIWNNRFRKAIIPVKPWVYSEFVTAPLHIVPNKCLKFTVKIQCSMCVRIHCMWVGQDPPSFEDQ